MAANELVYPAGWGLNDQLSSAQGQALQVQAGQSINRGNTLGGWRSCPLVVSGPSWASDDSGKIYMTDVSVPNRLIIGLGGLPNGHTLTAVRLWIVPSDSVRGGAQPANLPILRVFKRPSTLAVNPTLLGTVTATFASEAAYETGEGLTVTGLTEVIDLDVNSYFAQFVNEHGANSFTGLAICGIEAQVTIDSAYGGQDFTMWRKDA